MRRVTAVIAAALFAAAAAVTGVYLHSTPPAHPQADAPVVYLHS